ncbi:MAG: hypothetical protein GF421_10430 [Candidatus Aminicenantes bacterium]|nr:hypothetical protein [Candidatus Aminicenantes bacterium]
MKFRTKLGIFLVSCLITFIGFSLLVPAGAVEMIKIGKTNGYKITSDMLIVDVVKDSPPIVG